MPPEFHLTTLEGFQNQIRFMKKSILSLLVIAFTASNLAFAQGNASSYYRKIASEQRKIRTKQVNFYKTSLQFTDENRLNKGRDMVMTQINATKD